MLDIMAGIHKMLVRIATAKTLIRLLLPKRLLFRIINVNLRMKSSTDPDKTWSSVLGMQLLLFGDTTSNTNWLFFLMLVNFFLFYALLKFADFFSKFDVFKKLLQKYHQSV